MTSTTNEIRRMWINQPSTQQILHSLHGTNVLAQYETPEASRIYFLSGPVISAIAPNLALSPGWKSNPTP